MRLFIIYLAMTMLILVEVAVPQTHFAIGKTEYGKSDSTTTKVDLKHEIELGINSLGIGIGYYYHWFIFLSSDIVISLKQPGIAVGTTLSLYNFLFLQGVFGKSTSEEHQACDGPPSFKPDYAYGWRTGVYIPLFPKIGRYYLIIAGGNFWEVQKSYCYTCGGFAYENVVINPMYRTKIRQVEKYSFGLSVRF
jgi:hypothetical protein